MGALASFGFLSPWILVALITLPVLWWLLRAVPPAPIRRVFPAMTLLLGLKEDRPEAQRSPWWLILLRLLAVAALIIGFAGPVLNPQERAAQDGPLVVFIDSFWPAAANWQARVDAVDQVLLEAQQQGRMAVVVRSHLSEIAPFSAAGLWREKLAAMQPAAWDAPYDTPAFMSLPKGEFLWLSDGIARDGRAEILNSRSNKGTVTILEPNSAIYGLPPAQMTNGEISLTVQRAHAGPAKTLVIQGMGRDPAGQLRPLVQADAIFAAGADQAEITLSLPPELRHRISWFELPDAKSAGGVTLVGEALTRRRVALIGAQKNETLALLSPDHFLRAALEPSAEIIEALQIDDVLRASPHVIILPDVPKLAEPDQRALAKWVANGGLLLRFAGPRLAAAQASRGGQGAQGGFAREDVLLPVRLRAGGRVVGGAMSWGSPQTLAPFAANSPFYGLDIPSDVTVARQVLAEPDPDLAARTLAELADGTPLVTRKLLGGGQVILVHVGANAEWSSLVLSGLFVEMLKRLMTSSAGGAGLASNGEVIVAEGGRSDRPPVWQLTRKLSADGRLVAQDPVRPIDNHALQQAVQTRASAAVPPGVYQDETRQAVVNALAMGDHLKSAQWPATIVPEWGQTDRLRDLSGPVLSLGLTLLLIDVVATLWITGNLARRKAAQTSGMIVALALVMPLILPSMGNAQEQPSAEVDVIAAAAEVTLAHVLTGDAALDALAQAGLQGLSDALFIRTSVEPALPVGVDLERDPLAVYPILYWPISSAQAQPSSAAYDRLSRYLAAGGLILFDTRDAGVGGDGPEARKLRALAGPLGLPPLDPVPEDHVVTRAFYLLDAFPGRHVGPVWAEAAPPGAEAQEGVPFRVLNDGVTPVMIGGNDWAGAWAVRPDGAPLLPVGRGRAGDRQREMALRFGINLVMHVLTGNYKSDQVHIPALLQRLGQ